jgi:hypothetical protein
MRAARRSRPATPRGDIDWAKQGRETTDAIRRFNQANAAFWTKTTDAKVVDRRREAEDGTALAGATRDLVSSINEANQKYWADIEAARPRR